MAILLSAVSALTPEAYKAEPKPGRATYEPKGRNRKRLHLELPDDLYARLQQVSDENQTNVTTVIRNYLKLGLMVEVIKNDPGATLYIKKGDDVREVVLVYL